MSDLLKLGDNLETRTRKINEAFSNIKVSSEDAGTEGLEYALNADKISMSCTGIGTATEQTIHIASMVDGLPVTVIGTSAFYNLEHLLVVVIPDSVRSIGNNAFGYCTNLMSVEIPKGVTSIDATAFNYCKSLKSIEIPSSMNSIGADAFFNCTALKTIKFDGTIDEWSIATNGKNVNSGTGDYTIYCIDGKIAKDGTITAYSPVTLDINEGLKDLIVPKSRKSIVPSLYSVEYAVREAMPVWILMLAFMAGKDLYEPGHADYNKLILVANSKDTPEIAADWASAKAMASYFDRGYRITQLTRGFHNVLLSNIEFSFTEDENGLKTYTVKIEAEASKQDALRSMNDNEAGLVWLERYFSYFTQGHYIDQDQI
jgi:hypothetical protein